MKKEKKKDFLGKFFSPAKINLFLRVVGKRADNFNEIQSLFAFLDLQDEIDFFYEETNQTEKNLKPVCEVIFGGTFGELVNSKKNLFIEIFQFFVKNFDISKSIFLRIKKNIPVGAGLGGGSSNAAVFIKILNSFFCLGLTKNEMQKVGLGFGSDIPFFFEESASFVFGRGEVFQNCQKFDPIEILVVNPGCISETARVFNSLNGDFCAPIERKALINSDLSDLIKFQPNQLASVAIALQPRIGEVLSDFEKFSPSFAKMSGSGSTCFAKFTNSKDLEDCERFFKKRFKQNPIREGLNFSPVKSFLPKLVSKQKILFSNPALSCTYL